MSYQQLHLGKVKLNGLDGIRHHLLDRDRVKTNPNIDLTRSHLNHSIENLSPEHLERNVRQRIKQLHLKRKPRSDGVGLADIIVGASSDFMLQLGTEKREQYFANALYFFQRHHPLHPSPELKLEMLRRCFELGENVKLVAEEIGYTSSAIYTWIRLYE